MKTAALAALVVLLLANTIATAYLCVGAANQSKARERLSPSLIGQLDKMWGTVCAEQEELEKVAAGAQYPSEAIKKSTADILRDGRLRFQLTRWSYLNFKSDPTPSKAMTFLEYAYLSIGAPSFTHTDYSRAPFEEKAYANTTKLESLENDFKVFMEAFLKDRK